MIRVLLVDDHPLVTERLEGRLRDEPDVEVVESCPSIAAAQEALDASSVDVVVCDVRLPDGSGFELLERSRELARRPRFLMLSSFDFPQYVDAAQRLGASGYLLKNSPTDEILASIRRVASGGSAYALDLVREGASRPWKPLSPREREVLDALLRGRSNDEIAAELGISRKTVEAHLSRLFNRAGVLSRTELAILAERERWMDMPPERRPG